MKRSEMVAIISDLLEDWYAEHQPTKIADTFLTAMERHGMLPPEYVVDYSPMMTTNAWEPEDE